MGGKDAGMGDVGYSTPMIVRVWRKDGFVTISCVMLGTTNGSSRSVGLLSTLMELGMVGRSKHHQRGSRRLQVLRRRGRGRMRRWRVTIRTNVVEWRKTHKGA